MTEALIRMRRARTTRRLAAASAASLAMIALAPSASFPQSVQRAGAPLQAVAEMPSAGELVRVSGDVQIAAGLTAVDGRTYRLDYTCETSGIGRGDRSGSDYSFGGRTVDTLKFDGPLPAMAAAACPARLTRGTDSRGYTTTVEMTVSADGTITSVVVRALVPTP